MVLYMKYVYSSVLVLFLFFSFNFTAGADDNTSPQIPIEILYSPQRDIGFLVAALLNINDVGIDIINQNAIKVLMKYKTELMGGNSKQSVDIKKLTSELIEYPRVRKLIEIPALFDDFNNTLVAFDLILGKDTVNSKNEKIYNILRNTIFIEYPYLESLTLKEREIGAKLVDCIYSEYTTFYEAYCNANKRDLQIRVNKFKKAWSEEFEQLLSKVKCNCLIKYNFYDE
jgi:hypothetical protein